MNNSEFQVERDGAPRVRHTDPADNPKETAGSDMVGWLRTLLLGVLISVGLSVCAGEQSTRHTRDQGTAGLFRDPFMMTVDGEMLNVGGRGYAGPCTFDFDLDGRSDLLVGYWTGSMSELLIYRNRGTNANPVYEKPFPLKIDGKNAQVGFG